MQWSNKANVGLQPVPMKNYTSSFISEGEFSYRKVNVLDQQNHSDFFLIFWYLIRSRKQNSITSKGNLDVMQSDSEKVIAWSFKYKENLFHFQIKNDAKASRRQYQSGKAKKTKSGRQSQF
jgi:maltose alpha-D-glucosyltransferase/alpha-amylase